MDLNSTSVIWGVLALLLMAAEILVPGAFMLWLGFAAAVLFLVTLFVPDLGLLWQIVLFSIFSLVFIQIYRQFFRGKSRESDQPLLNRRADQLIGQTFVLDGDITQGRGTIRVGDAIWTVIGPELPAGTRVRVVGVDGMNLRIEAESF